MSITYLTPPFRILKVRWFDAYTDHDEVHEPIPTVSVGLEIATGTDAIYLAGGWWSGLEGTYGPNIIIPRGTVIEVFEIGMTDAEDTPEETIPHSPPEKTY